MSTRSTRIRGLAHDLYWVESDGLGDVQTRRQPATPGLLSILCSGSRRSWAESGPANVPQTMELVAPTVTVSDAGVVGTAVALELSTMLCIYPRTDPGEGALEQDATRERIEQIDPDTRTRTAAGQVEARIIDTEAWARLQAEVSP